MKISLRMAALILITTVIISPEVYAEYYLVYPASMSCCTKTVVIKTTKVKVYQKTWRSAHTNKVNRLKIQSLSTNCTVVSPCQSQRGTGEIVKIRYNIPRHHKYVNLENDPYNYDTTTADDEVMIDSDMNNQY